MKNLLLISTVLFLSFCSQAQSWDAKFEDAQFQNRVKNYAAFSRQIKKLQGSFDDTDFDLISDRCLEKDGVFRLEFSQDKTTITFYYIEWIDEVTIYLLVKEAVPALDHSFRIQEGIEYSF